MKIDVKHIAKLANLPLSKEEEEKYGKQLSKILEYMEKLNQLHTLGVEASFNVTGLKNVMREDEVQASDIKKKGFFVTKGVFNG